MPPTQILDLDEEKEILHSTSRSVDNLSSIVESNKAGHSSSGPLAQTQLELDTCKTLLETKRNPSDAEGTQARLD